MANQFTLLSARGKRTAANLTLARRCAALAPQTFIAVFNLGTAELKAGLYFESVATFHRALALAEDANVRVALQHIGLAHYASGNLAAAMECYGKALALKDDTEIQQSIAITRLMAGDLTALYEFECKYHTPRRKPIAEAGIPRWMGEDVSDKAVIVAHEQGNGDTIQFSRFIPQVKARRLIWSGPDSLNGLMVANFKFDEIVGEDGPFEADYYCSPISICGALKVPYSVVDGQPYMRAVPINLPPRGKLKIGLVWAGNPDYAHDHERSMALEDLAPLIEMPGTALYSFQIKCDDVTRLGLDGLIANLGDTLKDWRGTARAVAAMDLIVTVDSGVAHVAGALGKPVMILLPYANCWRWMLDRADSPWYASAKLFRQAEPGKRAEPVLNVKRAIKGMMNG